MNTRVRKPNLKGSGKERTKKFRMLRSISGWQCTTSYTRRECIVAFRLEGKSLVWWDWVKALRNLEAMTQE